MTLDNRFPWMQRVNEASALAVDDRARAEKIADKVCSRTGTKCAWDAQSYSLYFYYNTIDTPAFAFPFVIEKSGVMPVSDSDVEDMVQLIRMGQMPKSEKELIAEQNRAREEYDRVKERERLHAERARDVQNHADFLLRKRRGLQKTFGDRVGGEP